VEKEDRRAIVKNCLPQLSPTHREVLDLVYYHEKSVNEAAEIVGIPANTVKTRMFYARTPHGEVPEAGRGSMHSDGIVSH
jgi:RNA polymerase sigma-70 factor, ECF subfamily